MIAMNLKTPHSPLPSSLFPLPSSLKRGSALLIVLGMLSFMVVSAVSFAMFMRQSRAPSSYLRRSSTARYLLKAALANAITRLDGQFASERQIWGEGSATSGYCEGVYDDPYPGVGPVTQGPQDDDNSGRNYNGDLWVKRVFCPFGSISPSETVATLTLEALAYLPPAIINEVRVYSRRTRTARWRNLAYDAGRYAFTAVDVSDCFDINRLLANERRIFAPNQRVNLSSLFPQNGAALDTILTKWDSSKIPFVSVADFNIMAENSPFAPFYRYVNTSGAAIYQKSDAQSVSNALFITDTWFPPTNVVAGATLKRYDLSSDDPKNQPFKSFSASATFLDTAKGQTELCKALMRNIGGVGLACLYDYLDENDRPISFVVPTTETVPMVCGVGLVHKDRITPLVSKDGGEIHGATLQTPPIPAAKRTPGTGWEYRWVAQKFALKRFVDGQIMLPVVVAYPFKRAAAKGYPTGFSCQAIARVYMAPPTIKSRLDANSPLWPSEVNQWTDSVRDGVITMQHPLTGFSVKSDVMKTEDAVKTIDTPAQFTGPSVNMPVFWYVWQEEQKKPDEDGNGAIPWRPCEGGEYYSLDGIKDNANALKPYNANGQVEDWWKNAQVNAQVPEEGGQTTPMHVAVGGGTYVPHVLVWVRIERDGKTVDIVPARIEDDGLWGAGEFNAQGMAGKFGDGTPVLEFRGDKEREFKYDQTIIEKLDGKAEPFSAWSQLYAVDPRYNYAPENWFAKKGNGDARADEWLKAIGADANASGGLIGSGGRDKDIFMFTSDQERLQSIGELAFLPWVQEMDGSGDFFENDYLNGCDFNGRDFTHRLLSGDKFSSADMNKFASHRFMWRTYTAYNQGDGWDPIYDLRDGATPVEVASGTGDFRVNPFSPDSRVLMAALKDTPVDWFFASDNETRNPTYKLTPAQRNTWAFCEGNSKARIKDSDDNNYALEDMAAALRTKFTAWARRSGMDRFDWETAFRDLRWYDTDDELNDKQTTIFGSDDKELEQPLHGVDRKFLYSFWRECFQNRQQLFLVFLRAEPLTVGGMGQGSLASAQLGARGVALVWRDPQPPACQGGATRPSRGSLTSATSYYNSDNFAPHRTRVLFYHQFD